MDLFQSITNTTICTWFYYFFVLNFIVFILFILSLLYIIVFFRKYINRRGSGALFSYGVGITITIINTLFFYLMCNRTLETKS